MEQPLTITSNKPLRWDVFCRVIDNYGDIGVCWRLCADLAARGHSVRLWVDDATALTWMAPGALAGEWPAVQVLDWEQSKDASLLEELIRSDVWIEGFGCEIATEFVAHYTYSTRARGKNSQQQPAWINLEYLSAEPYVEQSHELASPIMSGPAKGWSKHFFYPGFSNLTGSLIRESDLQQRQLAFEQGDGRTAWLAQHGIVWTGEQLVSLFCYEPMALAALLEQLNIATTPTLLLVSFGRAHQAVKTLLQPMDRLGEPPLMSRFDNVQVVYLPPLTQSDFDNLLWACDLNFVRGEDSLARALWAGKALVWQIYPQDDAAHIPKLNAFLDTIHASASLREFHHMWNATQRTSDDGPLPLIELNSWSQSVMIARERLLQMDDLATRLVQFVLKKR